MTVATRRKRRVAAKGEKTTRFEVTAKKCDENDDEIHGDDNDRTCLKAPRAEYANDADA